MVTDQVIKSFDYQSGGIKNEFYAEAIVRWLNNMEPAQERVRIEADGDLYRIYCPDDGVCFWPAEPTVEAWLAEANSIAYHAIEGA